MNHPQSSGHGQFGQCQSMGSSLLTVREYPLAGDVDKQGSIWWEGWAPRMRDVSSDPMPMPS